MYSDGDHSTDLRRGGLLSAGIISNGCCLERGTKPRGSSSEGEFCWAPRETRWLTQHYEVGVRTVLS